MPHNSKNVDFPGHALNIIDIVYFPLVQYLDGHFLACENVIALLDLAERSLAERPLNAIVTDELLAHVNYLPVLLAPDWYSNLRLINALLQLFQPK